MGQKQSLYVTSTWVTRWAAGEPSDCKGTCGHCCERQPPQATRAGERLIGFKKKIIYFWVCWVFVAVCFSLVVASGSYSLVAVHGLLVVVASRCREHRSRASVVAAPDSVAQRLSCSMECRLFMHQGSNPRLLH